MTSPTPPLSFISVYEYAGSKKVLYDLMSEREPHQNISHKAMPSFEAHSAFVDSRPYKAWYLVLHGAEPCGAAYLSKQDEIGVFIFKRFRGKGDGSWAVKTLMQKHPEVKRFLANINPANPGSIEFFSKFHFKHIQNTYEFTR